MTGRYSELAAVGILVLVIFSVQAAHGNTVEVVTSLGNVFVLEEIPPTDDESGKSLSDGIGTNSRLVRNEYGGTIISGNGFIGSEESTRPYHDMKDSTRFVIAASDNPVQLAVPKFYHDYRYDADAGTLEKKSQEPPNILAYTNFRNLEGNITVNANNGIEFSGSGQAILQLASYSGQELILTGSLSKGTTVRIVQSPHDLMTLPHESIGFLINHCMCDPDTDSMSVLAGSTDDSHKSGTFEYTQSASATWYNGKCCKGKYTTTGSSVQNVTSDLVIQQHNSGYLVITGDTTLPVEMDIYDIARPGAKLFREKYNTVGSFDHKIYDTMPARELHRMTSTFETTVTFPTGILYLVIDSSDSSTSTIRATALAARNFISISDLPADTGYRIVRDDHTVMVGITTGRGAITVPAFDGNVFSQQDGKIYLYEDSVTHVGSVINTGIIFDHANKEVLTVPASQNLYNVHAYVKIPISVDVNISDVSLDGRLDIDYLDGRYTRGDAIFIPVVPTYKSIQITINGTETHLGIADILGGTGLYIADSISSDITMNRPDGFIREIRATASAITYMIATDDGSAKAQVQATVSGESEITNSRTFTKIPPPPPPPQPRDPLTTWIEVYVNGKIQTINGNTRTQIFFSDSPKESHSSGKSNTSAHHTAIFSYDSVTVTNTISVPVQAADFVEFHFYNQIYAQGSIPPVPNGYAEYKKSASAYAKATIQHASINTSM